MHKPTHNGESLTIWLSEAEKLAKTAMHTGNDAAALANWDVRSEQDELKNVFRLAFYFLHRVGCGLDYQKAIRHCI